MTRCYFAHPISEYGQTRRQRQAISAISRAGFTVENPDQLHHAEAYRERGMLHFEETVRTCDALAFMRFKSGAVGAGVGKEISTALAHGLPVFEVVESALTPIYSMPTELLDVAATKALLKQEQPTEHHVVALSGGKDSTALALRLTELEPRDYTFVCTPTGNEPPEMFAHWLRLGQLLGKPIKPVMGGTLDGLIRQQNALPNWRMRWCTRKLKIEPFAAYLAQQMPHFDRVIAHVGLRADEPEREGGDYLNIPGVIMRFAMREWGWGLDDVIAYLQLRGVTIPKRTDCMACFYQRLIEWWELWKYNAAGYAEAEAWETLTAHTFRSAGRDTWPAALRDLRARFEAGDVPKDTRPDPLKCRVCRL